MTDREKVITALRECEPFRPDCSKEKCPYYKDNNCLETLHFDVLELLEEHERGDTMTRSDMISKAEVLDIYAELYDEFDDAPGIIKILHRVYDKINRLKPQEHAEQKKGFWLYPTSLDCHCSVCGAQPEHEPGYSVPLYDYCPYCGAEMVVKWDA